MKLVKYKIVKLETPIENKTHRLEFESTSKHNQSGGYNCGVLYKGTYKECRRKKEKYANGI